MSKKGGGAMGTTRELSWEKVEALDQKYKIVVADTQRAIEEEQVPRASAPALQGYTAMDFRGPWP